MRKNFKYEQADDEMFVVFPGGSPSDFFDGGGV